MTIILSGTSIYTAKTIHSFYVIKLTTTLKDIITGRYLNFSPNFIIIDRKEE